MKRVGLLGGAFNPPHEGHLKLARLALEYLSLDELRFVPTALSPHKPTEATGGTARLALLRSALEGSPFRIETLELDKGGISYTVDTLETLGPREPDCAWILVMGMDQAAELAGWRRIDRIWELASVAAALRPGEESALPGPLLSRSRPAWSGAPGELVRLPGTDLDLSSSRLRERLRKGQHPSGIPSQVLAAIRKENLYR
jgi:nicotinate-nucleotide adenylyltransferase